MALAMGGIAAGVKFYAAYPMSPSTGVLMYLASHARPLGIMVRQVEDEIGVMNMVIGAGHAGCARCAPLAAVALMTEASMAGMIETPVGFAWTCSARDNPDVPTRPRQGDLWQALGAGQGDYPRIIVAPTDQLDAFKTIPELFNLCDKYQCPGLVLSDLLISEGTASVDPKELNFKPKIDRGELILPNGNGADNPFGGYNDLAYLRYKLTRRRLAAPVPGTPGHIHIAATDEHDEDGTLISDEFTNPTKRRLVNSRNAARRWNPCSRRLPKGAGRAGKRGGDAGRRFRKVSYARRWKTRRGGGHGGEQTGGEMDCAVPRGRNHAHPVAQQADHHHREQPERAVRALSTDRKRASRRGHIRKPTTKPFMPHHIVNAVKEQLAGGARLSVPQHEIHV